MTSSEPPELVPIADDRPADDRPADDRPADDVQAEQERAVIERSLGRLDRVARLMDEQFELPVVRYRVGLDPVLGLFPGGGDWATWVVSVYIFWESLRLGAPTKMLVRMVANVTVDLIAGYVPILGDMFDAAFKANRKNVDMLLDFYGAKKGKKHLQFPSDLPATFEKQRKKPGLLAYLVGLVVVLGLFVVAALPIAVLWWLLQ